MADIHPSLRIQQESPQIEQHSRLIEFGETTSAKCQELVEKMMDIEEQMEALQEEIQETESPTPDLETYLHMLLTQHTAIREAYQRMDQQLRVVERMVNPKEVPEA